MSDRWPLWLRLQARLALTSETGARVVSAFSDARARWAEAQERLRWRDPRCLQHFEAQRGSENGEDGILREIFRRLDGPRRDGPARDGDQRERFFVEFGVADGSECCTRALAEEGGWRGVWIEALPAQAQLARAAAPNALVEVVEQKLTVENLRETFDRARVPRELDLLVVDVDGNDYWLLDAALRCRAPRVIVVEYNGALGPDAHFIMPYDPAYRWDGSAHFGASLRALARLLERRGFTLVACDSRGVNAFFVARALVDDRAWIAPGDVRFHFASVKYHPRLIHGAVSWFPSEPAMPLVDFTSLSRLTLAIDRAPRAVERGGKFTIALRVHNPTSEPLRTTGPHAMYASYRWRDDRGALLVERGRLSRLLPRVGARATRTIRVAVTAPEQPGTHTLAVTLVQQGHAWLDRLDEPVVAQTPIVVR